MRVKRTDEEINDVRNWATEGIDQGSHYPGMSYEDGIEAALAWVFGDTDNRPDADN